MKIAVSGLKIDGSSKVPTFNIIEPGRLGDFVPIAVPHVLQKNLFTGAIISVRSKLFGVPFVNSNVSAGTVTKVFAFPPVIY